MTNRPLPRLYEEQLSATGSYPPAAAHSQFILAILIFLIGAANVILAASAQDATSSVQGGSGSTQGAKASSLDTKGQAAALSKSKKVNEAVEAALNGRCCKLGEMYTYSRLSSEKGKVNADLIRSIIRAAHDKALRLNKSGATADAAQVLRASFDLSHYLSCMVEGKWPFAKEEPVDWLDSWKAAPVSLPVVKYVAALNDYGFFLQKLGKNKEAIDIFTAVIQEDPKREVTYLNMADSLKSTGETSESERYYANYKQLMHEENKEGVVPKRVDVNRSMSVTGEPDTDINVVTFMDELQSNIYKAWKRQQGDQSKAATVKFKITRDGKIDNCAISKSSGDTAYDASALKAVEDAVIPKLPDGWTGDDSIAIAVKYNVVHHDSLQHIFPIDKWLADASTSTSIDDHLKLGQALQKLERFDDAEKQFEWVLEKQSTNSEAKTALDLLANQKGALKEAASRQDAAASELLKTYARKLATNQSDRPAGKSSAGPASNARRNKVGNPAGNQAGNSASISAGTAGGSPAATDESTTNRMHVTLHNAGLFALNNGAYKLAIRDLSQSLTVLPTCDSARYSLSLAYNNLGRNVHGKDLREALADFHSAYCVNPDNAVAESNVAKCLKKEGMDPLAFSDRLKAADKLAQDGDLVGAVVEYHESLKIHQDADTLKKLNETAKKLSSG